MTLKELIMQVGFDDLLPCLVEHEEGHLDNSYVYREAYDILRNMEPAPGFRGEIHVEWEGGEFEGQEKWIGVNNMDDAGWDENLAKEIVVDDGISLTPEELAMHCLWEITFYGFSPEEREKSWQRLQSEIAPRKPANPYEAAMDKLEESIWKHQVPRRSRHKGPNGELLISLGSGASRRRVPGNRSKRKRKYRQDKRMRYLGRMAARENIMRMLCADGSSFRRGDVEFLSGVEYGRRYDYNSVTGGTDGRLAYIAESVTKYQRLDLGRYDSAVVFLRVPERYPLPDEEVDEFRQAIRAALGYEDILFGRIGEDRETKDVKAVLLLNKSGK